MQLLKVICVVIPLILLLVASTSAVVYDDEGKVITKDEINKKLDEMHRMDIDMDPLDRGYYIAGGCLCGCTGVCLCWLGYILPLATGDLMSEGVSEENGMILIVSGIIAFSVGAYFVYYGYSEHSNRQYAIKMIKEKRHTQKQKQNEDKESFVPEHRITLTLLSGSF